MLCVRCGKEPRTGRMKTGERCRRYIHEHEKWPEEKLIAHDEALRIRRGLLATFAVIEDDEVQLRDRDKLQSQGIVMYRSPKHPTKQRLKRKAKAALTSLRAAQVRHARHRKRGGTEIQRSA